MNQDGSVRELSPAEKAYVSEEFHPGDSGRPYIKSCYKSRDGWGSLSGFIDRRYVPARITIRQVHPNFDAREKELGGNMLEASRAAGDIVETLADGGVSCTPNPKISRIERFKLIRSYTLAQQREREKLAAELHTQSNDEANA